MPGDFLECQVSRALFPGNVTLWPQLNLLRQTVASGFSDRFRLAQFSVSTLFVPFFSWYFFPDSKFLDFHLNLKTSLHDLTKSPKMACRQTKLIC